MVLREYNPRRSGGPFADAMAGPLTKFIRGPGILSAPMPRYMHGMARTTDDVFVQRDGNYGVALSLRNAMVRTTPGFASAADPRAWMARDQRLEGAGNPFGEHDPVMPHAH